MPDWFVQLLSVLGAPLAVYGGIRYDLGQLRARVEGAARAAEKANERMDALMMGAHRAS